MNKKVDRITNVCIFLEGMWVSVVTVSATKSAPLGVKIVALITATIVSGVLGGATYLVKNALCNE